MGEFRMPSLGADMDEATLLEWLVKPGDVVHRGDVIATVDTVKAAMDVEVFEDGVIDRLLIEPGTTIAVGTPLAFIVAEESALAISPHREETAPSKVESPLVRRLAEQRHVDLTTVSGTGLDATITRADVEAAAALAATPPARPAAPAAVQAPTRPTPPAPAGVRASPLARRRATELGIDLSTVVGTGPGGAISDADIEAAAPAPSIETPAPAAGRAVTGRADRSAAMRRATAALMARSKREIPHYYLTTEIDLQRVRQWLTETNAGRPVQQRLVPAALLLKAAAAAARRVPEVNGFWTDDAFTPAESVHLGIAISMREGGLIAPAIHDADTLTIDALMERLRDLVTRARTGRLRQSEMADPTLTVTNLGDMGVGGVYGVIYPPQVALVGFGRVAERPWAVDGMLAVRPVVTATLAADHRASDGHRGGRYLAVVDELLQKPEEL